MKQQIALLSHAIFNPFMQEDNVIWTALTCYWNISVAFQAYEFF